MVHSRTNTSLLFPAVRWCFILKLQKQLKTSSKPPGVVLFLCQGTPVRRETVAMLWSQMEHRAAATEDASRVFCTPRADVPLLEPLPKCPCSVLTLTLRCGSSPTHGGSSTCDLYLFAVALQAFSCAAGPVQPSG